MPHPKYCCVCFCKVCKSKPPSLAFRNNLDYLRRPGSCSSFKCDLGRHHPCQTSFRLLFSARPPRWLQQARRLGAEGVWFNGSWSVRTWREHHASCPFFLGVLRERRRLLSVQTCARAATTHNCCLALAWVSDKGSDAFAFAAFLAGWCFCVPPPPPHVRKIITRAPIRKHFAAQGCALCVSASSRLHEELGHLAWHRIEGQCTMTHSLATTVCFVSTASFATFSRTA